MKDEKRKISNLSPVERYELRCKITSLVFQNIEGMTSDILKNIQRISSDIDDTGQKRLRKVNKRFDIRGMI